MVYSSIEIIFKKIDSGTWFSSTANIYIYICIIMHYKEKNNKESKEMLPFLSISKQLVK